VEDVTLAKEADQEHRYNLTQDLPEKAKLVQHANEEGHKICWKETKVLQIKPSTIYRKYKESSHVCDRSSYKSTKLRHLSIHLENYNSIQCKSCFYVGCIQRIYLFNEDFCSHSTLILTIP
jgi:hypothetical protein